MLRCCRDAVTKRVSFPTQPHLLLTLGAGGCPAAPGGIRGGKGLFPQ